MTEEDAMVQFRRDWLTQLELMQHEMNRLLDHIAGSKPPMVRFSPCAWEPAIDVYETADAVVVAVELAGVKESDMQIVVDRDTFTIRGERRTAAGAGGKRAYHQMEIVSGPFGRSINLPAAVDAASSTASFVDGMVEVVLPKAKKRGTLRIKVQGG
jgi:HSP20 family protein